MRDDTQRSRWTWRIGQIAGIGIYIHATFTFLLLWIAIAYLAAGEGLGTSARGVLLVVCVFGTVVLHELSHALVARRYGVATRDITLYPIGGIARLERMPERPGQELVVALAGPMVNIVLAIAIYAGLRIAGVGESGNPLSLGASFAAQLMWINLVLAAFNLLPAFPMDGGRILRALLSFRIDRTRATVAAARVGRALAVVFGLLGLMFNPFLLLIAVFVWMTAGHEARIEQVRSSLRGIAVGDAMVESFQTLHVDDSLDAAAVALAGGFQHDFPVVDDDRVVGVLTRDDLLRGLATQGRGALVGAVMHRGFPTADSTEQLSNVLGRIPDGPVVVIHGDRLVGMLDPEAIGDVLAVHRHART